MKERGVILSFSCITFLVKNNIFSLLILFQDDNNDCVFEHKNSPEIYLEEHKWTLSANGSCAMIYSTGKFLWCERLLVLHRWKYIRNN